MVGPPLICRSVSDPPILASTRLLSSERRVLVVYLRQIWNQMDNLFCLFRKKRRRNGSQYFIDTARITMTVEKSRW